MRSITVCFLVLFVLLAFWGLASIATAVDNPAGDQQATGQAAGKAEEQADGGASRVSASGESASGESESGGGESGESASGGLDLVRTQCVGCHGLDSVCKYAGRSERYWVTKIKIMVMQWGMKDPGEGLSAAMASYLGGLPAGAAEVCSGN